MSWHYSRALVVEYSEANFWDGEPYVLSKSKHIPGLYSYNGKMKESLINSLCGTISAPLTESHGEEKSMSLQADSHARTYPQREKGRALKVVADEPVEIRFDIRAENPTTTEKEPNPREESIG